MPAYIDSLNQLAARLTAGGGVAADPNSPWMQSYVNQRANQPYWDPTAVNSAWASRGPYDSNAGYHPDLARYWGNMPGGWDAQGGQGQYATTPATPTITTPSPTPMRDPQLPGGQPPEPQQHPSAASFLDPYMAHQSAAAQAAGMGPLNSMGVGAVTGGGGGDRMAAPVTGDWQHPAHVQYGGAFKQNSQQSTDDPWAMMANHPSFQNYESFRSRAPGGWGQPPQGQQGQWGQPPAQQPPYGQQQPPRYGAGNTAGVWG